MNDNSNKDRLNQILEAIGKIEEYTSKTDYNSFRKNGMMHDAALLQLLVIGESIANIDQDILDSYDYPWHLARSFRNFIAHSILALT